jgi:phage host-nuclease inhibitor protein Gam
MSKSRIKIPAATIRTRAEMEMLAGEIADLKNRQRSCSAEMDAGLTEIRRHYAEILGGLDEQMAARMEMARAWAEANLAEFGAAKSLELTHAMMGYRTGQPQLKTLSGLTWERVLEKAKSLGWASPFVRTKMEVNKQQILLEREQIGAEKLRELGVRVAQEETFFVEPKLTEVERRESLAA